MYVLWSICNNIYIKIEPQYQKIELIQIFYGWPYTLFENKWILNLKQLMTYDLIVI